MGLEGAGPSQSTTAVGRPALGPPDFKVCPPQQAGCPEGILCSSVHLTIDCSL